MAGHPALLSAGAFPLAARVCTPETAGTTFALLMSLCNRSYSASEAFGGHLYDSLGAEYGYQTAFQVLVLVGAAFTALCWAVFPLLRRYAPEPEGTGGPVSWHLERSAGPVGCPDAGWRHFAGCLAGQ